MSIYDFEICQFKRIYYLPIIFLFEFPHLLLYPKSINRHRKIQSHQFKLKNFKSRDLMFGLVHGMLQVYIESFNLPSYFLLRQ